jgi:hypothetical protein
MAFQAEHALFPPLQEKLVGRSVRHVTARASLNTTGQMFKGEWAAFLDMAPGAGLVVYTAEGETTLAAVRCMAVGAAQGTFQHLVMHWEGKSTPHLSVTGEAQLGRFLPQQASGHRRKMRRMTVVTSNPRQLMLAPPELEPLGVLLVTGETDLRPGLGRFVMKGHQASHALATTSGYVGFARTMTGLAPPMRHGLWGDLLEELGMGSGTKIFRQVAMASYTDLRPDISALLLLRRSRCLLPLHKTPSHYRSKEC